MISLRSKFKSVKSKYKNNKIARTTAYSLVGALIFLIGLNVGNGTIIISKDQLYRNSIQKNAANDLNYASVEKLYDILRKNYDGQIDSEKILEGIKSGLVSSAGDPYTEYLAKQEAQEFNEQLDGTFSGIGAELGKDEQGNIIVISPISGFPAEKAGLKAQDIIVEVDGESLSGKTIEEAVRKIRGEKGTIVKLRLVRNKAVEVNLEITRDTITIPSVESKIIDGNIGYIKISRYGKDTVELTSKAANEFKNSNVNGVILDLRNNPGGLLESAVGVSNIWLDNGKTILQEKRDNQVIKSYTSKGNPILKGIKTVVLINEGSASASEITAGALHDNGAASLLGVKSFGKGSVQDLVCLVPTSFDNKCDGAILKVTIARWFTPNGINIDKEGIKPDIEVKLSEDDFSAKRDPQLDAAKASFN